MGVHRSRLTRRETAYGFAYGEIEHPEQLATHAVGSTPLAALQDALIPALARPPCVVSFSGGRDSSAILAMATYTARREGLALPVPITLRFRNAPDAEESDWQEKTVAHLALSDWERIEAGGEFDFVGPIAARCLERNGLLWPANSHFHLPLLERAGSGSLLTGVDGDTVLGGWHWARLASVLSGRVRPEPGDLVWLARAATPSMLRRYIALRRDSRRSVAGWLRPTEQDRYASAVRSLGEEPLRWDAHIRALTRSRYLAVACSCFQALADETGTLLLHPFLDRGFLAALARAGGALGWGDRTATMAALFGDILPRETVARTSKAGFDQVFWSEPSREFARAWDGTGVDGNMVDPDALRSEWLEETPHAGTAALLQAAWLHGRQSSAAAATSSSSPVAPSDPEK